MKIFFLSINNNLSPKIYYENIVKEYYLKNIYIILKFIPIKNKNIMKIL